MAVRNATGIEVRMATWRPTSGLAVVVIPAGNFGLNFRLTGHAVWSANCAVTGTSTRLFTCAVNLAATPVLTRDGRRQVIAEICLTSRGRLLFSPPGHAGSVLAIGSVTLKDCSQTRDQP
jgi:hypothetical protein